MSTSISPISSSDCKDDNDVIKDALNILACRIKEPDHFVTDPDDAQSFLKLKLSELEHEVFAVMFLDSSHGVIKYEEMFRGTINVASVYPREVVKEALYCNAAAVILAHNHPSGEAKPSKSDIAITKRLKDALALVDIIVLDHLVIGSDIVSFAESGLMPYS